MDLAATGSIVLYNNDIGTLLAAINSFLNTLLPVKLYLIDNSPTDSLKQIVRDKRIEYIHNPSNPGFGAGHNLAIKKSSKLAPYHFVINPDIFFDQGITEKLLAYLDNNKDIGVLMPQILYPNGQNQYLAKLLPTPFDFIIRRLLPFKKLKEISASRFELRKSNYTRILDVPFLSGCFLVFRSEVLELVEGFDENIFMYTEDIDICRRIVNINYRSVFYPKVSVFHDHEHKSFSNFKTLRSYVKSAIYYFNKWGWFFDNERRKINKRTLSQF